MLIMQTRLVNLTHPNADWNLCFLGIRLSLQIADKNREVVSVLRQPLTRGKKGQKSNGGSEGESRLPTCLDILKKN